MFVSIELNAHFMVLHSTKIKGEIRTFFNKTF
jgi:hypothetical protein